MGRSGAADGTPPVLQPARMPDLNDFHGMMSDPESTRFWPTDPRPDIGTIAALLEQTFVPASLGSGVVTEVKGRPICKAGAHVPPETSVLLRGNLRRRSRATEAPEALLAHPFATTGPWELKGDMDPLNATSLGPLKRLGFPEAGTDTAAFLVRGRWTDPI